jgi:hypothetical protein
MALGCERVEINLRLEGFLKPSTPASPSSAQLRAEWEFVGMKGCTVISQTPAAP